MTDSIREQIITAVEAKLAYILTSKGFLTECGTNIHRVRKALDQAELPACNIIPKAETPNREYGNDAMTMRLRVEALSVFGTSNPSEIAEKMLADLNECMTGRRWSMAFDSGSYEPQPGDTITGATSIATAYVESVTRSSGTWLGGDAAGTIYLRRKIGAFIFTAAIISPSTPEVNENIDCGVHTNCMTTNGAATYISPETSTCAGLADDIRYAGGGADEYPEAPDTTVGVGADFDITYTTVAGNPFARPA
jgi:hypothetical protein